jgi:hypothetical protein
MHQHSLMGYHKRCSVLRHKMIQGLTEYPSFRDLLSQQMPNLRKRLFLLQYKPEKLWRENKRVSYHSEFRSQNEMVLELTRGTFPLRNVAELNSSMKLLE